MTDYRENLKVTARAIEQAIQGNYGIIGFDEGVVLLRRGVDSDPEALNQWRAYFDRVV